MLPKNDADLLPLPKEIGQLYIGGQAAHDLGIQAGGWTIEWQGRTGPIIPGTTILEGIQAAVSSRTVVEYNQ
ncbi:MAG: beta-glucosidase, partial [Chloroflexus sp.]